MSVENRDAAPAGLAETAALAARTLAMEPTRGIPSWIANVMDMGYQERVAGRPPGSYREDPDGVHLAFLRNTGACFVDQYLATNPLTMEVHGYGADTVRTAATGAEEIVLDGRVIASEEDVVAHLEEVVFPGLEAAIAAESAGDEATVVAAILAQERAAQAMLGPSLLKVPYGEGFNHFPYLRYTQYGYVNYLTAFVMYPEVMARDFALQADLAALRNRAGARAIVEGGLPRVIRLDHDMADSRGTLVSVRMLEELWFPHFARAIQPYLDAGVRLIWHCDGNLMEMVPRLIACGVGGFQGFQYEDGMDYERICRMTTRDGGPLMIWGGVSVTRTLPFGTPEDVRREIAWLVEHAPPVGFVLGASSSVTPGAPQANLDAFVEGLAYYREHGRGN